jgi:hypothetical protein
MRKFLITAASAASMVAVVGMAPSALALNESAQLSSLNSGVSISGSVSTTIAANRNVLVEMYAQSNLFRRVGSAQTVDCATYGITLTINGSPQVPNVCYSGSNYVGADTTGSTSLSAGDVVTLTWGPGLVTSTASLGGAATIEVYNLDISNFVNVTPTLAQSSNSAGAAAPVLMWQQAYGRASATDACQSGYTPSWDTWPNGGKGGFVCNRFVPEYGN